MTWGEAIPAKDFQFALSLQHLADTLKSKAAVDKACNALVWVHSSADLASPTTFPFVCTTRDALQRLLAKPVVKKSPVTVEMLSVMVRDAQDPGGLADLWLATACLLTFAGFLCFSELVGLRVCNIVVHLDQATVHTASSKTDHFRKGDEVVIARMGNSTCPRAMPEAYMRLTGMRAGEQQLSF